MSVMLTQYKPEGTSYGVHAGHRIGGNIKSSVTNDETEFKMLTFRTY
jgi:hypothetical protein